MPNYDSTTRLEALATEYEATAQLIREGNADEYQGKAQAIRTTLQLLRDKLTHGAKATMTEKLRKAVKHRKQHRTNGTRASHPALSMASVSAFLREAHGTQTFEAIKDALHVRNSNKLVPYLVRLKRDGYVKKTAKGYTSRRAYAEE